MIGNRVIWKYLVPLTGTTSIDLPRVAQVRHAGIDHATGYPAIWIELDPAMPKIERRFVVCPTGREVEGDGGYPFDIHVGTVIDGEFVWHIYEKRS